jgi:Yip1 domain
MQEQQTASPAPAQRMSFTDKLAGIFSSPGEVYEQVRLEPRTASNWLIPSLLLIVLTIATTLIATNDPILMDQMMAPQRDALARAVQDGRITQDVADRQAQMMGSGSPFFLIGILVGTPIAMFIMLFLFSLAFWLLGKLTMKSTAPFMKVVEVYGLTFYIAALGIVVTAVLRFALGSFYASPSLALFVLPFDVHNKFHMALAIINVFTIWGLVVTSIGLAKLFQRDFPKVLVLIFAIWILLSIVMLLIGIPMA